MGCGIRDLDRQREKQTKAPFLFWCILADSVNLTRKHFPLSFFSLLASLFLSIELFCTFENDGNCRPRQRLFFFSSGVAALGIRAALGSTLRRAAAAPVAGAVGAPGRRDLRQKSDSNKKLLVTSASLLVTSALLLVTRSY